jgi:hypothetical protein
MPDDAAVESTVLDLISDMIATDPRYNVAGSDGTLVKFTEFRSGNRYKVEVSPVGPKPEPPPPDPVNHPGKASPTMPKPIREMTVPEYVQMLWDAGWRVTKEGGES